MSLRILLADDSAPMRRLIARFLQAAGEAAPIEAVDAEGALSLFKPGEFDLVICELRSSRGSDFDVIREIRQQDENVSILVMTTEAGEETVRRAIEEGADEYLVKPFDVEARQKLLKVCQLVGHHGAA